MQVLSWAWTDGPTDEQSVPINVLSSSLGVGTGSIVVSTVGIFVVFLEILPFHHFMSFHIILHIIPVTKNTEGSEQVWTGTREFHYALLTHSRPGTVSVGSR